MTDYVILRHGSNSANQSMTEVMPLTIIRARSRDAAKKAAWELFTVYNNQFLEAIPESRASKQDWDTAAQEDGLREHYDKP